MKAARLVKYGGDDAVEIQEVDKPVVGPGKVLVEVYAAGVNPFDLTVKSGSARSYLKLVLPTTIGLDFSGVIAEVGEGVGNYKVGDQVFGGAGIFSGGSFAEFTLADKDAIAAKPKNLSHVEAGSLPLAGSAAWQAMVEHVGLRSGKKILIHGGAGGIGSLAIQIAKHLGAYVATTVSAEDMEYVKALGADEPIDYKSQKFEDLIHDYDAVFDTVAGETYKRSYQVLKKGGIIVSMIEKPDEELMKKYGVQAIAQKTKSNSAHLEAVAKLVEEGVLKSQVDKVFPLSETAAALAYLEKSHTRGKVVIKVKEG
jgi:alcohol dehydrogenase